MSDTYSLQVGNKGRVVIPAALRERHGWSEGTILIAFETVEGVVVSSRDELERYVRDKLKGGPDVVAELIAERRVASLIEDEE
jgi:AbrB family looped-hinge helix DNA binding protein